MDNLKISNPNTTHKTKPHDKYLSQVNNEEEDLSLEEVLRRNRELELQIAQVRDENLKFKLQLRQVQKENEKGMEIRES